MFRIDSTSNKDYFIILKDGKEYVRIKKANNDIKIIRKHFEIEEEAEKWEKWPRL